MSNKFKSQFENDNLKVLIDTMTVSTVNQVKAELTNFIKQNFKTAERDILRLNAKRTVKDVQMFYYNYILVGSGNKVI